ncbi:hypothetical protein C0Q70_17473 [Pomacea canaliculata]|uniref:Chitin-binding type-2 domain-containing protein n=2 Tax=Pomacea canaliculata TaxID=400727 RepID=A0A2T7NKH9_POMCA|nr:hypothetical protein C0Q70_17473 [Pomacea canaliculata]
MYQAAASGFVHRYCTEDCTGLASGQYGHCDLCNRFIYCDHNILQVTSCPKDYTHYDWTIGVCVHHWDSIPCPKDWKPAPRVRGSVNSGNYPPAGITSYGPEKTRLPKRGGQGLAESVPEDRKKASVYTAAGAPYEPPNTDPYPPVVEVPPPPPPPPTTTRATTTTATTTIAATTTTTTTTTNPPTTIAEAASSSGEAARLTAQKSCGTPCHAQCPTGPKAQVYVRCGDCCYMVCSPEGQLLREACPHPSVRAGQ